MFTLFTLNASASVIIAIFSANIILNLLREFRSRRYNGGAQGNYLINSNRSNLLGLIIVIIFMVTLNITLG